MTTILVNTEHITHITYALRLISESTNDFYLLISVPFHGCCRREQRHLLRNSSSQRTKRIRTQWPCGSFNHIKLIEWWPFIVFPSCRIDWKQSVFLRMRERHSEFAPHRYSFQMATNVAILTSSQFLLRTCALHSVCHLFFNISQRSFITREIKNGQFVRWIFAFKLYVEETKIHAVGNNPRLGAREKWTLSRFTSWKYIIFFQLITAVGSCWIRSGEKQ